MAESFQKQLPPYGIRIPADLKARIQSTADEYKRSLHGEIIHTLEKAYPSAIGLIAFMRANEENIAQNGYEVEDISEHSEELFIRPNTGAGTTIDPRGFVRTSDGKVYMRVKCLP
ncbi:MAG: hypothetical protein ABJ360_22565 [Roseobacter sp.]